MKADFSRNSFDARKHYSAVLQQQGRVQVDADWNEQQQIQAHRSDRTGADVIGPNGAPKASPGFGLGFTADGSDLSITPGRFYVDGLLCELEAGEVYPFSSSGDSNATLAVPRSDLADFEAGQWVLLSPDNGATQVLRITGVTVADGSIGLALSAAVTRPSTPATGNFGGSLQRIATYLTQPDYPAPDLSTAATAGTPSALALANGLYIAYLDVWQRHIGVLDDPSIRETALGGPDTAARAKTVWQLRLLAVAAPATEAPVCGTTFPEWDALVQAGSGGLSARAAPPEGQAGPCLIPPGGGYQGLENQLYRIEIHDSGADGAATFKWSRDNGSVATRIQSFNGSSLTVDSTGPDDALGLANGQWVEILGDVEELQGRPGQLLQIATVSPATSSVSFAAPPTPIDPSLNPKMRRWDSAGPLTVPAGGGDWIDVELGVQIRFTAGDYASGDYWLVPARSGAAATVEWPHALPQSPAGVVHHYARLGLVNWTGSVANSTLSDCRPSFAPLTDIPPALHVTGISWQNDDVMQLDQFSAGLSLTLDGAPLTQYTVDLDPGDGNNVPTALTLMTANDNSMVVTLEMPIAVPNQPLEASPIPTMPALVVLPGDPITWNDASSSLVWVPSAAASTIVNSVTGGQARVRVRLKGDFIWGDLGQQRLYLDGETRGQPGLSASRTQSLRTDLAFPSGSGRRSSDFESWFVLQFAATPVSLRAFFATQSVLIGGGVVNTQVVLANLAQSAVAVSLASSSAPPVQVDVNGGAGLSIPAGQSTGIATVTVTAPATSSVVTVTASVPAIDGSPLTTTLSLSLTVVVLNVAVSPPTALLLSGASLRFSAGVTGVGLPLPDGVDTSVTWTCSGGTIDASGFYIAPQTTGTFTVTATSVADPSKTGVATVNVRTKTKDKDKDKEIREKPVVDKLVAVEKAVAAEKVRDVVINQVNPGPVIVRGLGVAPANLQQSFITPAERPAVGPAPAGGGEEAKGKSESKAKGKAKAKDDGKDEAKDEGKDEGQP